LKPLKRLGRLVASCNVLKHGVNGKLGIRNTLRVA
jgi:hypothetical protein